MRAAELVAGDAGQLPSEELLLGLARHDERSRRGRRRRGARQLPVRRDAYRRATTRTSTSGSARRIRMISGSPKRPRPRRGAGGPIST